MNYIKLAKTEDFTDQKILSFSVLGKKIGIVKQEENHFYAIEIGCKHQRADLTQGEIDGTIATCPRHGWRYDLETGICLNHDSPRLKRHDLIIDNGDIKVSLTPLDENEFRHP